jgi:formylglycine-generating enzyme required for sulfatase activity
MRRMQICLRALAALLLAAGGMAGWAGELKIQSFDGSGQIIFGAVTGATNYQLQTAPTPTGVWSVAVGTVPPTAANAVTATVSTAGAMAFYRVAAYTNVPPQVPQGMVAIPAGTNSGTDPDYGAYSLTNAVSFYMDVTEVTKARWDEVLAWAVTNGYNFDNFTSGKGPDHPVVVVNWYVCVKWCNARSEKEGRSPCYTVGGNVFKTGQSEPDCNFSASGYRLPTNTEWEYAARGGLSNKRFPWGDTITHSQANYYSRSSYSYDVSPTRGSHPTYATGFTPYTSPVGSFAANGYGLYDMAGNVWEWCNDKSGSNRNFRGGSWNNEALYLRFGYIFWIYPGTVLDSGGFRAVCRQGP